MTRDAYGPAGRSAWMDVDWREHLRWVRVDGRDMNVVDVGAGPAGKPGFADALDAMTGYPIRDRLGEITCPALVVWGELDRLAPLRDASEFEWLIPSARKIVHEDTAHLVMLERPARFDADLRAFLDEDAGAKRPWPGTRTPAK